MITVLRSHLLLGETKTQLSLEAFAPGVDAASLCDCQGMAVATLNISNAIIKAKRLDHRRRNSDLFLVRLFDDQRCTGPPK